MNRIGMSTITAALAMHEQRWFALATGSLALHAVNHWFYDASRTRVLSIVGLSLFNLAYPRIPQRKRPALVLVLGTAPTLGAFAGHIIPLLKRQWTPATETAILNLGGGVLLLALGTTQLRTRATQPH